ncbi:hypothetical protein [Homoserinibacter sp. GY 40078]|uniref:hypothetical protein n=1 Tax=Homoserinibacter sp. GY 40078 TaxID=2603275 RepID=UPI0011C7484D|nr:hypothetical protein [Homoserinibacter sp. GY 40078]TXK18449.1 hypothetical protein FVQ89_00330 [Homoserinibacter sp. GY 40078]
MSESDFDLRVERVRKAAEVIGGLPSKALQAEAFRYLLGDVPATSPAPEVRVPSEGGEAPPASQKRARSSSATKTAITQDRDLNLFPEGKTSFKDFAATKSPSNNNERYAVAVYWLREVAQVGEATVAQVVSCYRNVGWALPTDVANAASQAVKATYLSSGKADDLKLSSTGINLVDTTLPRAKK